jgi:drug/metabolite transporter (DMT)-like permease
MSWFIYALLAAFLYSSSIVIDKFLLNRQLKRLSEISYTAIAALAGIPFLAVLLVFVRPLPNINTLLYGLAAGWLLMIAYQFYYMALRRSDAALVTTLFQLLLVFNFIFGVSLFNDQPSPTQIVGLVIIAVGVILISLEEKEEKWRLRGDVLLLMIGASLLLSLSDVVFKFAAEDIPFFTLAVSEYISSVIAGLLLITFIPKVRREFRSLMPSLKKSASLMELNETFMLTGTIAIRYALVIGPLALIQGVMGTQPFMVIIIVTLLSLLGIKLNAPKPKSLHPVIRRLLEISAIILVCIGSTLISGTVE